MFTYLIGCYSNFGQEKGENFQRFGAVFLAVAIFSDLPAKHLSVTEVHPLPSANVAIVRNRSGDRKVETIIYFGTKPQTNQMK